MSTPDRDAVETVTKLLAERRKVGDWLVALEGRRDSTPPAVFQKVHDDYAAKLDKVQAKLVAASDSVHTAAADVATRLTDKEEAVARKREERAEAELRFAVGEYSEKEWERRRAKHDDELGLATGERDTLRDELHRLREVLAEVAGREGPAGSWEEPASADAPAMASGEGEAVMTVDAALSDAGSGESLPTVSPSTFGETTAPERTDASEVAAEAIAPLQPTAPTIPIHEQSIIAPVEPAQPLAPSFDELAFLKSVVGRPTPVEVRHPAEPALVPKRATPEPRRATPTPRRGVAQPPPPTVAREPEPTPVPEEPNPYALPEPPTPFPDPVPEPRVSQEMTPPRESFFGRPTPRTSEAIKSLRCQECGTLNFPTEWYCERCGGELAAL